MLEVRTKNRSIYTIEQVGNQFILNGPGIKRNAKILRLDLEVGKPMTITYKMGRLTGKCTVVTTKVTDIHNK